MNGIYNNKPILPVGKPSVTVNKPVTQTNQSGTSFGNLLELAQVKQSELKFSKHALDRLQDRNIKLSKEDVEKINNAVNKAAEKGVKETLILMKDLALIANVRNKTVITAATGENLKENVFTNIDGAVII